MKLRVKHILFWYSAQPLQKGGSKEIDHTDAEREREREKERTERERERVMHVLDVALGLRGS